MDYKTGKNLFKKISKKYPAFGMFIFKIYHKALFKTCKKKIRGKKNNILFKGAALSNVVFDVVGNNNSIVIKPFSLLRNVKFIIRGDWHEIEISEGCRFNRGGMVCMEDRYCILSIGAGSTFEDVHIAVTEERSRVSIGSDCMFAYDIDIRTGDSHGIWDLKGNRINKAKNIVIGDHVWVGAHTSILKGVKIKYNSIIATGAIVTKGSEYEGSILGGNPASVIKKGIMWTRDRNKPPILL